MRAARERMAGRPTKLDDLTAKRICDALKAGVSRRAAANAARVDDQTLSGWMKRGRDTNDEPYVGFRVRVLEAESQAEKVAVDTLFEAMREGKWQAAESWLARRRAKDWAQVAKAIPDEREDDEQDTLPVEVLESLLAAAKSRKAG